MFISRPFTLNKWINNLFVKLFALEQLKIHFIIALMSSSHSTVFLLLLYAFGNFSENFKLVCIQIVYFILELNMLSKDEKNYVYFSWNIHNKIVKDDTDVISNLFFTEL